MDTYDLEIIQGDTYSINVVAKNTDGSYMNLSGYNISGSIKFRYSDNNNLLPILPTVVSAESGIFNINLSYTDTKSLPITRAVYDVEAEISGSSTKLLKGYANIYPEVTR
jgi:hypothetical protein